MKEIQLPYGTTFRALRLHRDDLRTDVFLPKSEAALPEPEKAIRRALRHPIGSPPLRELAKAAGKIAIVTSDGTRPVPNRLLLPAILEEMDTPLSKVIVLLGTGSHRPNTEREIRQMFGSRLTRQLTILNHDAYDSRENVTIGKTENGTTIAFNRHYVEADLRIVLGFIEPHFFAGFSGGAKGILPGIASIGAILHIHRYDLIAHPDSTWCVLDTNPIQQEIQRWVAECPPHFLVNVTLNMQKEITGVFAGDYRQAHREGVRRVAAQNTLPVSRLYPVVITTNSGYPLDQNLYQTVKGLSAAARIVQPGGTILAVSECADGVPAHGKFFDLMKTGQTPDDILAAIRQFPAPVLDQWEAQILAQILKKARVFLFSSLDPQQVRLCKLQPLQNLEEDVRRILSKLPPGEAVAVLPYGPLTVPAPHKPNQMETQP